MQELLILMNVSKNIT